MWLATLRRTHARSMNDPTGVSSFLDDCDKKHYEALYTKQFLQCCRFLQKSASPIWSWWKRTSKLSFRQWPTSGSRISAATPSVTPLSHSNKNMTAIMDVRKGKLVFARGSDIQEGSKSKRRLRALNKPAVKVKEHDEQSRRSYTTAPSTVTPASTTCEFSHAATTSSFKSCLKQTCSASSNTAARQTTKTVSFDSIQLNEHHVILGDNPSVTSGPPLTIAWESQACYHSSVDDYELSRPSRRTKERMIIPRNVREEWLRKSGYARSDMEEAQCNLQKMKRQRAVSAKRGILSKMLEKKKGMR